MRLKKSQKQRRDFQIPLQKSKSSFLRQLVCDDLRNTVMDFLFVLFSAMEVVALAGVYDDR